MHCAALLFAQRVANEPPTLECVYDQITASEFPATVPELIIWARLMYSADEAGPHAVGVTILDTFNGEQIGSSSGRIELPHRPERGHPSNDVTFRVTNSQIPHAGEYELRLTLDDQTASSVWLTVVGASALN